ncbi:UDP-D-xylose:L-fucose alpha-1,3-D-xylosyltransferase 3-like isoform X2 [Acanthaster planci]|uniref:UDP-D-xylose:L-fucose alpha-1,3-D-xylosyltransferase 3-like isoform X2 n=1 Tax=Acanthaster planci TaxID=133434 RepID=A0A8B7XJI3_ACAPL|nr:UDP-D-xylose:L-fucose alpha-1,3-D-xylosyltransferase 3-like isoform X2 [Acanthaster planci]
MPPPLEIQHAATTVKHVVIMKKVELRERPRVYVRSSTRQLPVSVRLSQLCYQPVVKSLLQSTAFVYLVLGCLVFFIFANADLSKSAVPAKHQLPPKREQFESSRDSLHHNSSRPLAASNQSLSKSRNDSTRWPGQAFSNHKAWKDSLRQPLAKPGSASSSHEARPSSEPPRIVLLVTNQGFEDFTENLLRSIKKAGSRPNITIITEDQASFNNLTARQPGVHIIKAPDLTNMPEKQEAFDFGVKGYVKLVNRRPGHILGFLQKGFEVFSVDSDSYWFKDPFPYFQGDFDVAYPKDVPWAYNAGIGFYKPTAASIKFLKHWIQIMATQAKMKKPQLDQRVMNTIISSRRIRGLRVRHLKDINFPCAKYYSKTQKCDNYTTDTVLVHAAYLAGHELKKTMFEQCKLWLL